MGLEDTRLERPSLARNSTARLAALLAILVFGFTTSVMTARWLGPSGKGTLTALSFLGDVFFFQICLMGLGEASIVLIARGEISLQRALSASLIPLFATGIIGMGALLVVSVPAEWSGIFPAVVIQGVVLFLALYMHLFQDLLHSRERFGTTSLVTTVRVMTNAVLTGVLLSLTPLGIGGALLATLCGVSVALFAEARALKRMGLSFRPVWDKGFMVRGAKLGLVMQAAYLLMAMSQRADQLVVYSLLGPVEGGQYAVALTLGLLPGFVPVSLTHVSFPRFADVDDREVWPFTAQVIRVGLIGGGSAGLLLAGLVSLFTPAVFGEGFGRSIAPALILMSGGLIWSVQWTLSRAWAARGRPALMFASFLLSVMVMLSLDLLLLPAWGMVGAAVASVIASASGLSVCLIVYGRAGVGFRSALLVPRLSDMRFLTVQLRELIRGS